MPSEPNTEEVPAARFIERRLATIERLPSILTVEEVTRLLRLNRKTVYELVQKGRIPGARRFGRNIRLSKLAFTEWLKSGGLDGEETRRASGGSSGGSR